VSASGVALAARVFEPLLAVVFPSRCLACRHFLAHPTRGPLCTACWRALPRHVTPLCACGGPCGAARVCARCRRGLGPFSRGASLGPFEGTLRTLIHELKYRGRRRVAARLAELLMARPEVVQVLSAECVLLPVPLHPRRRRERGFNQADLLARELGRRSGLPVASALVRRKDTRSQTGLSAAARRANVAGAFAVRHRPLVAGRRVILVDDVTTTGATVRACAQTLRAAGAAEVRLLTLARVL
jgi:ComF family protein